MTMAGVPVSDVDRPRNGGRRSIRRPGKWSCPANKFGRSADKNRGGEGVRGGDFSGPVR